MDNQQKSRGRIAMAAALACSVVAGANAAKAEEIVFMAGTAGGSWHALAGGLKSIIEHNIPDTTVVIRPGGTMINLEAFEGDLAPIGWTSSVAAVDGINGKDPFVGKPLKNVCAIGSFHNNVIQNVTNDPEIKTIADLKGKRVGTLPRGLHTEQLAREELAMHGLTTDDLAQYNLGSFSDNVAGLKDGHIDVFLVPTAVGNGAIMDFMSSDSDGRIMPVTDEELAMLQSANGAWKRFMIPANTYPNQPEEVPSATFPNMIAASCTALSEERAYEITKAILENYEELGSIIAEFATMKREDIASGAGIPMHPGAERAYHEAGLM